MYKNISEKYITNSAGQTQKLGENFAKEILKQPRQGGAVVLGLKGNLGRGKTTFLQGFAKGLGAKEKILSPTFVIQKKFQIQNSLNSAGLQRVKSSGSKFKTFYHFDCYRLNKPKEILELGFKEIIADPENIVAIEWPEKVKKILPKEIILIKFKLLNKNKREIIFKI